MHLHHLHHPIVPCYSWFLVYHDELRNTPVIHTRVPHCLRRLDPRDHHLLHRPNPPDRRRDRRERPPDAGLDVYGLRERHGWADGREYEEPDAVSTYFSLCMDCDGDGDARLTGYRGYVALAVSSPRGTFTRELDTGLGGDREGNMVRFAEEGLRLLGEVVSE